MNDIQPVTHDTPITDIPAIRHGFSVGQLNLLIPTGIPVELFDEANWSPIPLTPSWFKGMTNLRGEVIPVFSLPQLLSAKSQRTTAQNQNWLLILDKPPRMSGLLIDVYPQLLNALQEIDPATVANIPALIKPYTTRAFRGNDQNWLDFDCDAWLLSLKTLFQNYLSLR